MHRAAKTSRFLINSSSSREFAGSESVISRIGSIQHVVGRLIARPVNSCQVLNAVTQRLTRFAEHAYSLRDMNALQEASLVLMKLPIADAHQVGQYYQALTLKRKGETEESQSLLEAIADSGPLAYRARAIQTLGALHHDKGLPAEALRFHLEARRVASSEARHDWLTTLLIQLEISHVQGDIGDHRRALNTLEELSPLVRIVAQQHPLYYYFYHNELAVEFRELGLITEAEAACAVALASPFASAYPEWSETRDEIAAERIAATPSAVAVTRASEAIPSPRVKREPTPKSIVGHIILWPFCKDTLLQRASKTIAVVPAIFHDGMIQRIRDWMLSCFAPRAPPLLS